MKCSTRNGPKLVYYTPLPDVDSYWVAGDGNVDHTDRLPRRLFVSVADLFFYALAIVTFVSDVVSDLVVAYYHFANDRVSHSGFYIEWCLGGLDIPLITHIKYRIILLALLSQPDD